MRDYKSKMERYRLPKQRYKELKEYCLMLSPEHQVLIEQALQMTTNDQLCRWLYKHITQNDYGWAKLEADGLPCGRDTFRVVRARFYWMLDGVLKGANTTN